MATKVFPLVWLTSLLIVRAASSYNLAMTPSHTRAPSKNPQTVSFGCSADVATPLVGCQFRWWARDDKVGPLMDLSRGAASEADSDHLYTGLVGYSYSGRGLAAGDCGVSLQTEGGHVRMMACRVRTENGSWTYAWADLFASSYELLPNVLTPREIVVLPGGEARFTLKADDPLRECRFLRSEDLSLVFNRGAQSWDSSGRYRYLGAGVETGECGLRVTDVGEADNGPFRSYVHNRAWTKADHRFMMLIVARPPIVPTLTVVYTDTGVTATCVVHEGRPVANITWILGNDVVRRDSLDDSPVNAQDEWRWPWMQVSIVQRLTFPLRSNDNGKVLKCVASHVALSQSLQATAILSFARLVNGNTPLSAISTTARTAT